MSVVLQPLPTTARSERPSLALLEPAPARMALLGTGTVGSAVLRRLAQWQGTALGERLSLVYVANSRVAAHLSPSPSARGVGARVRRSVDVARKAQADNRHDCLASIASPYPHPPTDQERLGGRLFGPVLPEGEGKSFSRSDLDAVSRVLGDQGTRILIDATASAAVAERHAEWLALGIHVVTACKLAQGTSLQRWHALQSARSQGGTEYGDSATVGAGLPLLRSIRALQAGGDRIHAIAGVLSGSLAWLFHRYDGLRPFSGFVREARDAGYTEPDPREDLSGEDVRRKLLILARAAGVELDVDAVDVHSLVPAALAALDRGAVDAALPQLDAPLRARYADAYKSGEKLRFVARLDCDVEGAALARVGLESLPPDHPLSGGAGTDNRVAIWSDRYREQPLLIQGPGAGADVTAAALLDDALAILRGSDQAAAAAKNTSIGCGCRNT